MGYIRGLFALILVVIVLLIGCVWHFLTWLVGLADPSLRDRLRYGYVHLAVKLVWIFAGGPTTVIGLDRVPMDRTCVFVGNHRSILDILAIVACMKKPVGFIAKQELEKVPLLRMQMLDIKCLFLDRQDARKGLKTILTAIEYVKSGWNMFVFPEGTRNKVEGTLLEFHAGSFKIATKPGVPLVPVTLVNTGDLLEDHFPRPKRVPVIIEFGEPIETEGMDRKQQKVLPDQVRDLIQETYDRNSRTLFGKTA